MSTVEPLYNGHLWGTMFWPLYRGGLNLLRGCFIHKLFIWDLDAWPLYSSWPLFAGVCIVNMYNVSWCWVAGVCIVVILRCRWLVLVVPYCKYMASCFPVWCTDVTMFGILVVCSDQR